MKHSLRDIGFLGVFICLLSGCEPPALEAPSEIEGAEFLEFRCVTLDELGRSVVSGQPLENCGCTTIDRSSMVPQISRLGRVECSCLDALGSPVDFVKAGECGSDACEPAKVNGDWVPSDAAGGSHAKLVVEGKYEPISARMFNIGSAC